MLNRILPMVVVCLAAFGQSVRTTLPPRGNAVLAQPAASSVTIYERKNFTGRSQTLASGDNRLTDVKPQSIRVPAGTVAYLYQSSMRRRLQVIGGPDGRPRDLSEFGLAGNVAFITVSQPRTTSSGRAAA